MSNPVDELFSSPIPKEVWHYTTLNGFEGILSSGTIFATDARFTNDKTEFIDARDIANGYLKAVDQSLLPGGFPLGTLKSLLDKAFDYGALSPSETNVYITSFSDAPDSLSQWREYGEAARGVSIGFDLSYIRPPKEVEVAITFAPCVYDDDKKTSLIESAFGHFVEGVVVLDRQAQDQSWLAEQMRNWQMIQRVQNLKFNQDEFEKKLQADVARMLLEKWRRTLFDLLRVASHCKARSFLDEHEWRLALSRPTNKPSVDNPILYRGPKRNIPYMRSNLFKTSGLPVTRVMTGPLCADAARVEAILSKNGYGVPVITSSVPLRDPTTI